ncbi:hypothetical protein F5Y18DRAFT_388960 [Xylariaceae sp. FL1019]|nr:hypothetical protein F5Y18DRAFT_388960 [Xylariaceae sp. FL1019]
MKGSTQSERVGTSDQDLMKKPRKWAPKSRLGCKTCKIRRIKCDLSRPSCSKCTSTGRSCDGYSERPFALKADSGSGDDLEGLDDGTRRRGRSELCTMMHGCETKQRQSRYHGPILQHLQPLMVLPVDGSAQEGMGFFEQVSIRHLNEYQPCAPWRRTLMFFSQTVPTVRYAAVALGLMYRKYLSCMSSTGTHRPAFFDNLSPDNAPLLYYNRAIHLLLTQEVGDVAEKTTITLLVCYLFTCFEHLSGNDVQAMKHLRGGVELSRSIGDNNDLDDHAQPTELHMITNQVKQQIRRLDMQAATSLVDWVPADIQDTIMSQLLLHDSAFRSLDEAADHLQTLVARVMRIRNAEQQMCPTGDVPLPHPSYKDMVLGQLETWSCLFRNMLRQGALYKTDSKSYRPISLLRLQYTISWTLLSSYGPGREMEYDNYLPYFQQCIALAEEVASAHEQYSGSARPTFTAELGILPVLYIIGAKCRHPTVRREALRILRRQAMREGVWDSITASRVVERIIEIEEGGAEESGGAQNMGQIAVWQRIEALTWLNVFTGQSPPRLDIGYTFCNREGIHTESLIL